MHGPRRSQNLRPSTPGLADILPAVLVEVGCPVVHQLTPTLEQVRQRIGRPDDLSQVIGLLGCPARKLDRKPCRTAAMPRCLTSL